MGNTYNINVDIGKRKCEMCGKVKSGCFEARNAPGKFICDKCIIKNIDKKKTSRIAEKISNSIVLE